MISPFTPTSSFGPSGSKRSARASPEPGPTDQRSPTLKRRKFVPATAATISTPFEKRNVVPRFWIVERTDGDTFARTSPFVLQRALVTLVGKVVSTRKDRSGSLLVEVSNSSQGKCLSSVSQFGTFPVKVSPHSRLNTSRGVISCKDLTNCSEDEICKELAPQGVVAVKQVVRKVNGIASPSSTFILTFDTPVPPERLEVAFYALLVRPFVPAPLRCFKCLRFGHISLRCRLDRANCNCGKPEHTGTECSKPFACVNCGNDHSSRSSNCPIYLAEKEIQRVRTLNRCSYLEAKRLVGSSSYVRPAVSYAAVAGKSQSATSPVLLTVPVASATVTASVDPLPKKGKKKNKKKKVGSQPTTGVTSAVAPPPSPRAVPATTSKLAPTPLMDLAQPQCAGPLPMEGCSQPSLPGPKEQRVRSPKPVSPKSSVAVVQERGCNTSPIPGRKNRAGTHSLSPRRERRTVEVSGYSDPEDLADFEEVISQGRKKKKGWPKGVPRKNF